ncbi:cysteine desulfurase-like protein [Vibrio maerlii]|uniref:cysteine desulfurase-like protein n=1 Tax=Vibrio maerlii TaxID=2231648 RepID=UPI000E3C4BA9|nr:cysteine desulfurase-like protein [Vibrio maerlii]
MHFTPDLARIQFAAFEPQNGIKPSFLDGPGGSQVPVRVVEKMGHYLSHYNSNLGGHFYSSMVTTELMTKARTYAQNLLNAESSDQIVFGPNMTSLTFSLSRAISRDWVEGDEVVVTALDHYSNVSSWQQAAEDRGAIVHQARVDEEDCGLDFDHLEQLVNEKTKLIAVTAASNTTGSLVDISKVVELAKRHNALVYVDAVHFAPHHLVDVQAWEVDFLACSAYKFFGPHLGMAYVHPKHLHTLKPYKVEPATNDGPGRFETGTQSFEALSGFIEAVEYLAQWGGKESPIRARLEQSFKQYEAHEAALCRHFLQRIEEIRGVKVYGRGLENVATRTPTFALRFDGTAPETVAKRLGEKGICVWNGHFYALGLIKQLGLLESGGVVRVGFMHYNTLEEIDDLIEQLKIIVN